MTVIFLQNDFIQAPDGTQLEVPSPQQQPGRAPKYQIHLESGAGQIHVLLINKEHNSDPVVVEVPPPPEIAAALKREEGGDILSLAQTLIMSGVKRERQSEAEEEGAGPGKRARYEGESEPGSEEGYESSSERENSLEFPPQLQTQVVPPTSTSDTAGDHQDIEQEFNIPNIQTDIPGLEELISSESKRGVGRVWSSHLCFVSVFLRLSPPPTEKDYCYNLDNSEGVCDLFDVL